MFKKVPINFTQEEQEDKIIKDAYTTGRQTEDKTNEAACEEYHEETEKKAGIAWKLMIIAFLTGIALATIAQYYANSDMRNLNSTITEWKQDQERASKNNAIIQRAVNDNKSIEQRQIKRASDVEQIITQILTPKSVTIK